MALFKGSDQIIHVFKGTQPIKEIYKGNVLVWQNTNPPQITRFTVTPTTIDLDNPTPANVTIVFVVAAGTTDAQVYLVPQGTKVGVQYSSLNAGNTATFTAPRPTQDQTYRVVANNSGGASHLDATVLVTQNPALSNLAAAGLSTGQGFPGGANIRITGKVVGYPRPSISIDQGWRSPLTDRHFTPVAGEVNAWTFTTNHVYITSGRRAFVVTATNSSGTVTGNVVFNA